jgi:hypothetical protein
MDHILLAVGIVSVLNVLAFLGGYMYGQMAERRNWNKLIQEGRLPHPVVEPERFRRV